LTLSITSSPSLDASWRSRVTLVVRNPEVKKTTVPMMMNVRMTRATMTSISVNPADPFRRSFGEPLSIEDSCISLLLESRSRVPPDLPHAPSRYGLVGKFHP
jgi:hypothetical protein